MSERDKDRTPEGQEPVTLPLSLKKGLASEHQQHLQRNLEQAYSETVKEGEEILKPLHLINEMIDEVKNPSSLTDTEFLDVIAEEEIFNKLHHVLHQKVSPYFGLETLDKVFTNREVIPHSSDHLQRMVDTYFSLSEKFQDEDKKKDIDEKTAILLEESLQLLEHEAYVFGKNIAESLKKLTPEEQKEIKKEIHKVFNQHFQKRDYENIKKTFTEKVNLNISQISDNPEKTAKVIEHIETIFQIFNETPLAFHNDQNKTPRKEQDSIYLRLTLLDKLERALPKTDASERPITLLMDLYHPILEYFEKKSRNSGKLWTGSNTHEQIKEKVSLLGKRLMKYYDDTEEEEDPPF